MFWQGGGKKRLKNQIEMKMELPPTAVPKDIIGKTDDELLPIYYHRDATKQEHMGVNTSTKN
jgi:hypothetical protein